MTKERNANLGWCQIGARRFYLTSLDYEILTEMEPGPKRLADIGEQVERPTAYIYMGSFHRLGWAKVGPAVRGKRYEREYSLTQLGREVLAYIRQRIRD